MIDLIGLFPLSYLIGALPQVYLFGRIKGVDLRKAPDLHITLYRQVSRPLAILGIAIDVAKGPAAVFIARLFGMPLWAAAVCGLLALAGQMWSLFPGTGGRGNTTGFGLSFALSYSIALWGLIPLGLGFIIRTMPRLWKRGEVIGADPSLGTAVTMLLYFATLPALSFCWQKELPLSLAFMGILALIILRRLTVGLREDLRKAKISYWRLFFNRLLYDRSF